MRCTDQGLPTVAGSSDVVRICSCGGGESDGSPGGGGPVPGPVGPPIEPFNPGPRTGAASTPPPPTGAAAPAGRVAARGGGGLGVGAGLEVTAAFPSETVRAAASCGHTATAPAARKAATTATASMVRPLRWA